MIKDNSSQSIDGINNDKHKKITINYIALGDSIARGAALDVPEEKCYPYQLYLLLKSDLDIHDVNYLNLAVDGQTTSGLINMLEKDPKLVENADIITISIGANNILGVFLKKMQNIFASYDIPVSAIYNTGEIFNNILSGTGGGEFYQKVFASFTDINRYIYSSDFETEIITAAAKLESDLPKIIKLLQESNKDAIIAINTIYNPYKNLDITVGDTNFFSPSIKTDEAIYVLNEVIEQYSDSLNYIVIPIYTKFDEYKGLPRLENAFFNLFNPQNTNIDVHPTEEGHKVIAEVNFKILMSLLFE